MYTVFHNAIAAVGNISPLLVHIVANQNHETSPT